jgi:hypothetical protein
MEMYYVREYIIMHHVDYFVLILSTQRSQSLYYYAWY